MRQHYGHKARILHWCTDQAMTHALAGMELTAAQGQVMGYLAHRQEPPCAKDIEDAFRLSHPTVSGILSRLEKKGFIGFRPDEKDRRIKRICILPKGEKCLETMHQTIRENDRKMVEGFTEEEKKLFAEYLERAIANMGREQCHCKEEGRT